MAIRNIIQKAEQEFPPAIKQELDPVARPELALLSGYVDTVNTNLATTGSTLNTNLATTGSTLNTKIDNLSGYSNNTFYTKNNPSGFITGVDLSSYATVTNLNATGSGLQSQINNRVTNLGAASGIQVMTTGAYNSGTPLSGVVYILI